MSCSLILKDSGSTSWLLSCADDGALVTQPLVVTGSYPVPTIASATAYWIIGIDPDGTPKTTSTGTPTTVGSYQMQSPSGLTFLLTVDDAGIFVMAQASPSQIGNAIPFPLDISMSTMFVPGLLSTITGPTPLTVLADYSIWSCALNKFINEDTTNIIVALDE